MKRSKRLLAVLLALSMTATLAACSPENTDEPSTDPSVSGNQPSNEETLPAGETGGASVSEPDPDESTDALPVSGDVSATQPSGKQPQEEKSTAPKADENDPTKMSKAALVNYYNTAANDAKKNAKSITKTKSIAKKVSDPEMPDNPSLEQAANFLMNQFLKTKDVNEVYSSAADKKANFPVKNQDYSSTLSANDVSSASCNKSGNNYVLNLKVKSSGITKAFNSVSKQEVIDSAASYATFSSIDVSYGTSSIKATISSNGKLLKVEYDQPSVTMSFTVAKVLKVIPLNVQAKIVIGLGDWFTINW